MKHITFNHHFQLRRRIAAFLLASLPIATFAQDIEGSWKGVLDVGGAKLNLVFHLNADKTVTMDSPDQGAMGIPTKVKYFAADSLCIEMEAMNVVYSGKLVGEEIKGTFSQMGYSFPLNLKKGEGRSTGRRLRCRRSHTKQRRCRLKIKVLTRRQANLRLQGEPSLPVRSLCPKASRKVCRWCLWLPVADSRTATRN